MSRSRRRTGTALVALAAATAVAVAAGGTTLRAPPRSPDPDLAAGLAPPVVPAFVPGRPRALGGTKYVSHWAPVERSTVARSAPRPDAPAVAHLTARTPEGTRNTVSVIARDGGAGWVRARLPVLPNGTTGWMRRSALGGYGTVHTRLEIDLTRLRAALYRDGRRLLDVPIGAGMPGWPTPRGEFYVRNKLTRYRSPAYGPVAFGTSARSPRATDWPAGGYVGIHGTDHPELIPGRVSHGCIRLRDADILALARQMPVGTPVRIR